MEFDIEKLLEERKQSLLTENQDDKIRWLESELLNRPDDKTLKSILRATKFLNNYKK